MLRRVSGVVLLSALLAASGCSHASGASGRRVPVLAKGSATFVAARKTDGHKSCGNGLVRDYETDRCFGIDGVPVLRASDIASARVVCSPSPPPVWLIFIDLTSAAAARFDRFVAAHPGTTLSIVAGSVLLTSVAFGQASYLGFLSVGDMNLTQVDAQRIVVALSGPETTERPSIPKGAIAAGPTVTVGSCVRQHS